MNAQADAGGGHSCHLGRPRPVPCDPAHRGVCSIESCGKTSIDEQDVSVHISGRRLMRGTGRPTRYRLARQAVLEGSSSATIAWSLSVRRGIHRRCPLRGDSLSGDQPVDPDLVFGVIQAHRPCELPQPSFGGPIGLVSRIIHVCVGRDGVDDRTTTVRYHVRDNVFGHRNARRDSD